jgi:transcriptional regulator with XRE-family HTH domain
MKDHISACLKRERRARGWSQAVMAECLGMSCSSYSRIERAESTLYFEQLVFIAKRLDMPITDFFPPGLSPDPSNVSTNNQNTVPEKIQEWLQDSSKAVSGEKPTRVLIVSTEMLRRIFQQQMHGN